MYTQANQMTPFFPPKAESLVGLSVDLIEQSAHLGGMLHPITRQALIAFLRLTNSYYSNLIEDHHTHPVDIERAMANDYAREPAKRALQIEGLAHVEIQELIDSFSAPHKKSGESQDVCSPEFICRLHREFYNRLPEDMRQITDGTGKMTAKVVPGELRRREVEVGRHIPPTWESLPRFLDKFHGLYEPSRFSVGTDKILAAAASHHRLVWIHPFLDGNGRVARLMTDAYFQCMDLRGAGLWTISRGLARHRDRYMVMLAAADASRQGDLDGRGNLSQSGLVSFCTFFLKTCLDQIAFMERMLDLPGLVDRIQGYVILRGQKLIPDQSPLKVEAAYLLREALLRGQFARGEASRVTGLPERTARMLVSQMVKERLLVSDTPKGPLQFGLPAHVSEYYLPSLI